MKSKGFNSRESWNWIIVSLVVFVVLMILVMYLPNMSEIDGNILHSIRLALSPYPSYIPAVISEFGRYQHMLWPQIATGSVLISHQKEVKTFLLIL